MESLLRKYRVYHYVTSKNLPDIVLDEIHKGLSEPKNFDNVIDVLIEGLKGFFDIIVEIYSTKGKDTFKTEGYIEQYRQKAIQILEERYDLLNNYKIDQIILGLLSTNEQYNLLASQRRECALSIHKFFFELLFSDHYNTLTGAKTVEEIDKIVLEAKHAKSRVLLKHDPDYIPTEEIRMFVVGRIEALLEHAGNMKEWLRPHAKKNADTGNQKPNTTANYTPIVDEKLLLNLNRSFAGFLWENDIAYSDLCRYWSFSSMPEPFTNRLLPRQVNGFVFLLHKLNLLKDEPGKGFTNKQVGELFGIDNIDSKKSRALSRHQTSDTYSEIERKLQDCKDMTKGTYQSLTNGFLKPRIINY